MIADATAPPARPFDHPPQRGPASGEPVHVQRRDSQAHRVGLVGLLADAGDRLVECGE
ncbi:hypothetical protein [Streptomyces sp. NPDC088748]|uniref:hypothetical protein n=1 Tax=Streptomyces sp. NPDC088748 TaxID=3365887 RepID=UPI0037F77C49